jgi:hypothetical protein
MTWRRTTAQKVVLRMIESANPPEPQGATRRQPPEHLRRLIPRLTEVVSPGAVLPPSPLPQTQTLTPAQWEQLLHEAQQRVSASVVQSLQRSWTQHLDAHLPQFSAQISAELEGLVRESVLQALAQLGITLAAESVQEPAASSAAPQNKKGPEGPSEAPAM